MSSSSDFQVWLDQEVWVQGDYKVPRRDYIPAFAEELTKSIKGWGYTMDPRWNEGDYIVAKWMYMIHVQEFVTKQYNGILKYSEPYHRNFSEDFLEYTYVMSFDRISSFMERWRFYEDLDPDTRCGQRILHELQNLVYPFIDMDNSKNGMLFDDYSDTEEEVYRGGRDDVYITEAKQGLHGGRGSKV